MEAEMLTDMQHEQLSASSTRHELEQTANWEADPLRWMSPPTSWPDSLTRRPDTEFYVDHPLQHPAEAIGWEPIQSRNLFGPELLELLVIQHRVLIADSSSTALRAELLDGMDPTDPARLVLTHTELAGRPFPVTSALEWRAQEESLTLKDWQQLEAVWEKLSTLVSNAVDYLASQRALTEPEAAGEGAVLGGLAHIRASIAQLTQAGVNSLEEIPI